MDTTTYSNYVMPHGHNMSFHIYICHATWTQQPTVNMPWTQQPTGQQPTIYIMPHGPNNQQ